ncbi:hypothetical protein M9H77_03202 [Catharanthus roseus]|uniref:Uncharacterized protein n=1 Tax=Catharanthus roseus TaxID=4058 RepID=A0ACC0CB07_CATRO|nr:hypothetical protein M9H77_03202 [Catharanthus roseus]
MYEVSQNVDLSLKVDALSKKFDQLLALNTLPTNSLNVQGVCAICSSPSHVIYDCPSASLFPEFVQEQVNSAQGFHRQNDPYSNTYNPGWRNHPNFSWRQQGEEVPHTRASSDDVDGFFTLRVDPLEEGRSTLRAWPNQYLRGHHIMLCGGTVA